MTPRLPGKVAVITAASTGFGRGMAVLFARHGARVVIGDLKEETTPGNFDERPELTTVQLIRQHGGDARFVQCDVTRQSDMARLLTTAVNEFGRLDVMVNNAGIYRGGARLHEQTEDALTDCWNVLVKGAWFGCQEAIKIFLRQGDGGNIINIVSTAGLRAHEAQSPYNVAKAAQAMLTQCVAMEYAPNRIRANAICPTYVKTSMSRGAVDDPVFGESVKRVIPLGRWGEISDVANAALFLASDESAFIDGALIPVDGGESLGDLIHAAAPNG